MSEIMRGVLNMPPHCWANDAIDIAQRHGIYVQAGKKIDALELEIERLRAERDALAKILAVWCVRVKRNGTGWDDWDESYKAACYTSRPTDPPTLRALLDATIAEVERTWDDF
jgi:hypothetical protein